MVVASPSVTACNIMLIECAFSRLLSVTQRERCLTGYVRSDVKGAEKFLSLSIALTKIMPQPVASCQEIWPKPFEFSPGFSETGAKLKRSIRREIAGRILLADGHNEPGC
jgi:hypothetical protein